MLTDWIVSAAEAHGLPVQSTSIPGVAQRTGATTYYIEIFPVPLSELDGKRPVLALSPGVGDVDVVVASELLEAGRAISSASSRRIARCSCRPPAASISRSRRCRWVTGATTPSD